MVRVMLRDGHVEPDIREDDGDVICRITGGLLDTSVREFFDDINARDSELGAMVRTYIAITDLLSRTPLRPERLAVIGQCSENEAFELLVRLAGAGALRRMVNGSRSFMLTDDAAEKLRSRIDYKRPKTNDEHWQLIRAYLDVDDVIGRDEAAELLGVRPERASAILSELYNVHNRLGLVGKPRGRGVRYKLIGPNGAEGDAGQPGARARR